MTNLNRPIRRQLKIRGVTRPIIIELNGETQQIIFREKGRRHSWKLPIATAFLMAVRSEEK